MYLESEGHLLVGKQAGARQPRVHYFNARKHYAYSTFICPRYACAFVCVTHWMVPLKVKVS